MPYIPLVGSTRAMCQRHYIKHKFFDTCIQSVTFKLFGGTEGLWTIHRGDISPGDSSSGTNHWEPILLA